MCIKFDTAGKKNNTFPLNGHVTFSYVIYIIPITIQAHRQLNQSN